MLEPQAAECAGNGQSVTARLEECIVEPPNEQCAFGVGPGSPAHVWPVGQVDIHGQIHQTDTDGSVLNGEDGVIGFSVPL